MNEQTGKEGRKAWRVQKGSWHPAWTPEQERRSLALWCSPSPLWCRVRSVELLLLALLLVCREHAYVSNQIQCHPDCTVSLDFARCRLLHLLQGQNPNLKLCACSSGTVPRSWLLRARFTGFLFSPILCCNKERCASEELVVALLIFLGVNSRGGISRNCQSVHKSAFYNPDYTV